ncbi:flagellin [Marinomonas mediterranea]|jgi:Flagellin and related hook-associated proteins|uniref:Flagellin n=1 Tax=Marinomonas mediterranea (strain ATCC 700492 / JCM 21426 / NBRC 103028 / MMB-1) TaxID=717774 RepID=F2K2W7_MARM1|nr:flagellin [Marinomonas mediterranea]ADZ92356.1 flagellin domain protein [Marinomonas mediterranea MMB-1]WCN10309.1 flagellin [Marinomonas mediterranea]WCN14353.1 flagellin [Marinomonas mediterranea]WCN18405.1 flagellin [Marinomonas mediterranea MMB-1]
MSIGGISGSSYASSSATQSLASSSQSLASGLRINSASDDAAGLAIANRLTSQIDGNGQAVANSVSGISATQIAQSGLESVTNDLTSLRELAVQAGNGIYSDSDRQALQQQADELIANIQDTIDQTSFAGTDLLSEDGSIDFQVGADADSTLGVTTNDLANTLTGTGLFSLDITDQSSLDTALTAIDDSIDSVSSLQADYGATENAFTSRVDSLLAAQENESAARSRIQDTDYAAAVSEQIAASIREQSSVSVQAQANADAGRSLSLLLGS